jgi:hypothetical protein
MAAIGTMILVSAVEKANELVDKYRTYLRMADKYDYLDSEDEIYLATQCALVAVDEIINDEIINADWYIPTFEDCKKWTSYWKEVEQEINNFKQQEQ